MSNVLMTGYEVLQKVIQLITLFWGGALPRPHPEMIITIRMKV